MVVNVVLVLKGIGECIALNFFKTYSSLHCGAKRLMTPISDDTIVESN